MLEAVRALRREPLRRRPVSTGRSVYEMTPARTPVVCGRGQRMDVASVGHIVEDIYRMDATRWYRAPDGNGAFSVRYAGRLRSHRSPRWSTDDWIAGGPRLPRIRKDSSADRVGTIPGGWLSKASSRGALCRRGFFLAGLRFQRLQINRPPNPS
jgi:hypothetical protein